MRRSTTLLLTLPALLMAQDKAPETIAQRFKAEQPGLDKLLKERDGLAALAKAQALIPEPLPAYDKSSPAAGMASSSEYSALMALHSYAGKAALVAGDWEKALGYFKKAEDIAKTNAVDTVTALAPTIESWTAAIANAKKAMEEGAARKAELKAKTKRDEREDQELKNFEIHENNIRQGPLQIARIKGSLDGLKSDSEGFNKAIDGVQKSLAEEKENLTKFKGDKAKYVSAVFNVNNMAIRQTVEDKLNFLVRLTFLDPRNTKVQKEMDRLMGKAPAVPEKTPKGKAKKKGK